MLRPCCVVLVGGVLLAGPAWAGKPPAILERTDVTDRSDVSLDLAKGARLEVKGVRGAFTITRAAGERAVVSFERDAAGSETRILMVRHEGGVTICAVYPSPKADKPNECVPGKGGRMLEGIGKTSPAVRFKVELPDGVSFMGKLFDGTIDARPGTGDVDLEVQVGTISILDAGSRALQAKVYSGTVDAVISPVSWLPEERVVALETLDGELSATLPSNLHIWYSIMTDKPVTSAFDLEPKVGGGRLGHLHPEGKTALRLSLIAGLGRVVIRRSAN